MLRLPLEVRDIFKDWLEARLPDRAAKVMSLVSSMRDGKENDSTFGRRMTGTGPYAWTIGRRFELACQRLWLQRRRASSFRPIISRRPPQPGEQLTLFESGNSTWNQNEQGHCSSRTCTRRRAPSSCRTRGTPAAPGFWKLGFKALATTSAGLAFSLARPDGTNAVSRAEAMANAAAIVPATSLPVSADLENGYGAAPEACAETIRQAAAAGWSADRSRIRRDATATRSSRSELAAERVRAAAEAAHAVPFPFMLTARAENYLHGRPRSCTTRSARLQAFQEAGADVLFAPGLRTRRRYSRRHLLGRPPGQCHHGSEGRGILRLPNSRALGVKRISVGSVAGARRPWRLAAGRARNDRVRHASPSAMSAMPHAELERTLRHDATRLTARRAAANKAAMGDWLRISPSSSAALAAGSHLSAALTKRAAGHGPGRSSPPP